MYEKEVEQKWQNTDEYKEYKAKTKNYSIDDWNKINNMMENIFRKFALLMNDGKNPNDSNVQYLVKLLQNHITDNYYTCSNDILKGLGQMYISDDRFKSNIDKYSIGTSKFINDAIIKYTKD